MTNTDNDTPPTKFYVVNDAATDRTYEYGATGTLGRELRPEQRQHRPARGGQHGRRRQGLGRRRQQEGLRLQRQRRPARLLDRRQPGLQRHGRGDRHQRHRRLDRRRQAATRSSATPAPPAASRAARTPPAASTSTAATPAPRTSSPTAPPSGSSTTRPPTRCSSTRSPAALLGKLDDRRRQRQPDGHHARPGQRQAPLDRRQRDRPRLPVRQRRGPHLRLAIGRSTASPWPPATPTRRASPTRQCFLLARSISASASP